MRYKYIGITGTILVTMVVALSGLMYYFGQDKCPMSTFLCRNSTICLPQRDWCNGSPDCPEGDDEADCLDLNGSIDIWFNSLTRNKTTSICDPSNCPSHCRCYSTCRAVCSGYTEIPPNLPLDVMRIILTNSSLLHVSVDSLTRYAGVTFLYLAKSKIYQLQEGAFANQRKMLWLVLSNNHIREIRKGHLYGLSSLEYLLADNNQMERADFSDFENSTTLEWIDLSNNSLTSSNLKLPYMPKMKELNLHHNRLDSLTEDLLSGLPDLKTLILEENRLQFLDPNVFRNTKSLVELNLAGNEITTIPSNLFHPLGKLIKLSIGYNPIQDMAMSVFSPLKELRSLSLQEIDMDSVHETMIDLLPNLVFVNFNKFYYCTTYAPHARKCRPTSDGVSSLSHLLGKRLLRAAVWGISCVTCLGNALVLWGRFTAKDENRVLSIVIRNLAVSDMLMGVYLLIIALEDSRFRDNYHQEAHRWMASWPCTMLGILAMVSSEVSVLILSFMSVERFMLIAAPLKSHRGLTPQAATSSMIAIWVIGVIFAVVPAIHWRSSTKYYGVNGMCFPLHIDDPFLVGWQYSAFIFLGVNFTGLVVIGYVYAGMFASIWRTRHATPLSVGDSEFALRFFLIVLTDAACWAPIIVLKIMAFAKYPVAPDLHAWVVVFILPVNSAVNPLLYTFTTPKFRERLSEGWFGMLRNYVTRKYSSQDTQISSTLSNKNIVLSLSNSSKYPIDQKIFHVEIVGKDGFVDRSHHHAQ